MILVLLTLMSDQPYVHEGGRLGGRQSGRKCGDVDESMSNHGTFVRYFSTARRFSFAFAKFELLKVLLQFPIIWKKSLK